MTSDAFHVYDTTLRDGTQREGLSLSVEDKLAVARHLDDIGVGFIEGGWPGANAKDTEFFRRAQGELDLATAQLAAFGSTRRPGGTASRDLAALRDSGAGVVTLVAKADVRHVERALRTTRQENLSMVRDSVAHLRSEGRRVFLDAEHFFDGYAADRAYAKEVLLVAAEAGADVAVLCDTNGGMLPMRLAEVVDDVLALGIRLGIHAHDDAACAVANSLAAVSVGATHVQGTANGYGERCGNADLFSVVAALEHKMGLAVLPPGRLAELSRVARAVAEVANIAPDPHQPWAGASAFAHKAGLHVSAVKEDPDLYQHADPAVVGNDMRVLVSELAGRATIEMKGRQIGLIPDREQTSRVLEKVKDLEAAGHSFEAAEASFELLLRAEMGELPSFFELEGWRVIVDSYGSEMGGCEATVKLSADGDRIVHTGEGNGPVDALDNALRGALGRLYPRLADLELVDYKVRVVDGGAGTAARVRVLITASDGNGTWSTASAGANVIAASWEALRDGYTVGLLRPSVPKRHDSR
jgi:2-isopropylmalate synthase